MPLPGPRRPSEAARRPVALKSRPESPDRWAGAGYRKSACPRRRRCARRRAAGSFGTSDGGPRTPEPQAGTAFPGAAAEAGLQPPAKEGAGGDQPGGSLGAIVRAALATGFHRASGVQRAAAGTVELGSGAHRACAARVPSTARPVRGLARCQRAKRAHQGVGAMVLLRRADVEQRLLPGGRNRDANLSRTVSDRTGVRGPGRTAASNARSALPVLPCRGWRAVSAGPENLRVAAEGGHARGCAGPGGTGRGKP